VIVRGHFSSGTGTGMRNPRVFGDGKIFIRHTYTYICIVSAYLVYLINNWITKKHNLTYNIKANIDAWRQNFLYFLIIIVHKNAFFHVLMCRIADFSCAVVHMRLKKFVPDRKKLCILYKKGLVQVICKTNFSLNVYDRMSTTNCCFMKCYLSAALGNVPTWFMRGSITYSLLSINEFYESWQIYVKKYQGFPFIK